NECYFDRGALDKRIHGQLLKHHYEHLLVFRHYASTYSYLSRSRQNLFTSRVSVLCSAHPPGPARLSVERRIATKLECRDWNADVNETRIGLVSPLDVLGENVTLIFARDVALKARLLSFGVEGIGLAAFVELSEAPTTGCSVAATVLHHDGGQH